MVGDESEVTVAMVHPGGSRSLVADLRVRLWREHMRLPESASVDAGLRDLDNSLGYFRRQWGTGTTSTIPHSALDEVRGSGLMSKLLGRAPWTESAGPASPVSRSELATRVTAATPAGGEKGKGKAVVTVPESSGLLQGESGGALTHDPDESVPPAPCPTGWSGRSRRRASTAVCTR